MSTVAVMNQGGSAGKTVTVVTLAAILAGEGKRVLVVDADQQSSATQSLGVKPSAVDLHLGDVLHRRASLEEAVIPTRVENLDLLPATRALAGDLIDLGRRPVGERLRRQLDPARDQYDTILIDCPSSENIIIVQALMAADHAITVVTPTMKEVQGVGATMDLIEDVAADSDRLKGLAAIVRCTVPPPNQGRIYAEVSEKVAETWPSLVTPPVRRSARVPESYAAGEPLTEWAPYDPVTKDYHAVRSWLGFEDIL